MKWNTGVIDAILWRFIEYCLKKNFILSAKSWIVMYWRVLTIWSNIETGPNLLHLLSSANKPSYYGVSLKGYCSNLLVYFNLGFSSLDGTSFKTYLMKSYLCSWRFQTRNYFILLLEKDPIGFISAELQSYLVKLPLKR